MVDAVAALSIKIALFAGIYKPVLSPNIIPPSLLAAAVDMAISPGLIQP